MGDYHLTKCEMDVMDIVWRRGRATVQNVVDGLERPLAYTTVMTALKILKSKRGVLRCEKEGRAFVYEALVSREDVSRGMALELKERLFGGSAKWLLLNLLENESLSKDDIHDLRQAINEFKAGVNQQLFSKAVPQLESQNSETEEGVAMMQHNHDVATLESNHHLTVLSAGKSAWKYRVDPRTYQLILDSFPGAGSLRKTISCYQAVFRHYYSERCCPDF